MARIKMAPGAMMATLLASLVLLAGTAAASSQPQCSLLLKGKGYSRNLDGQHGPMRFASSVQDCCAFCHATPGCSLWSWNGPPPGNGDCYAKAANSTIRGALPGALSGSTDPSKGPPLPPTPPTRLTIASPEAISTTERTYASWNIDSSCNRGFHHIHFANKNLLAAAKALAPSKLRFGGSGNDALVYGLSPGSPECAGIAPQPAGGEPGCGYITAGCLNATHWDELYNFGEQAGVEFIFGVAFGSNTSEAYVWDPANAASLLKYMAAKGQDVFGFELGNEVNNNGGLDDPTKTQPKQQADALKLFAPMVAEHFPSALLIGPDSGYKDAESWLRDYLQLVAAPSDGGEPQQGLQEQGEGLERERGRGRKKSLLHAVTHHVYDAPGRSSFNSASGLDGGLGEIGWYTSVVKEFAPGAQIWAGEDGPTGGGNDGSCGGNHSICTTYASALTYADDLGLRAKHGFVQYQRQAFFGGAYGLTDTAAKHPQSALGLDEALILRPGFWVNFLWKRVLGQQVLSISSSSGNVRAYGFRGSAPSPFAAEQCDSGSGAMQLLMINLNDEENTTVSLEDCRPPKASPGGGGAGGKYAAWVLTPPSATAAAGGSSTLDPFATDVYLNGHLLPDTVDTATTADAAAGAAAAAPVDFLQRIPVAPLTGSATAAASGGGGGGGLVLPPISIAFLCYTSE